MSDTADGSFQHIKARAREIMDEVLLEEAKRAGVHPDTFRRRFRDRLIEAIAEVEESAPTIGDAQPESSEDEG